MKKAQATLNTSRGAYLYNISDKKLRNYRRETIQNITLRESRVKSLQAKSVRLKAKFVKRG